MRFWNDKVKYQGFHRTLCAEEWPTFNLKNVLICYCKNRESKVDISNDAKNGISPGWEKINNQVINSQQDMISQFYLLYADLNGTA